MATVGERPCASVNAIGNRVCRLVVAYFRGPVSLWTCNFSVVELELRAVIHCPISCTQLYYTIPQDVSEAALPRTAHVLRLAGSIAHCGLFDMQLLSLLFIYLTSLCAVKVSLTFPKYTTQSYPGLNPVVSLPCLSSRACVRKCAQVDRQLLITTL